MADVTYTYIRRDSDEITFSNGGSYTRDVIFAGVSGASLVFEKRTIPQGVTMYRTRNGVKYQPSKFLILDGKAHHLMSNNLMIAGWKKAEE